MAQIEPVDSSSLPDVPQWDDAKLLGELAEQLSRLGEPWVALRNGHGRASDGPPWVDFVLLHPLLGVTLINAGPGRSELEIPSIRNLLTRALTERSCSGHLPIVAIELVADEARDLGNLLISAFEKESECILSDPGWCVFASGALKTETGLNMVSVAPTSVAAGSAHSEEPSKALPTMAADPASPAKTAHLPVPVKPRSLVLVRREELRASRQDAYWKTYSDRKKPGWRQTRFLWAPMASLAAALCTWVILESAPPAPPGFDRSGVGVERSPNGVAATLLPSVKDDARVAAPEGAPPKSAPSMVIPPAIPSPPDDRTADQEPRFPPSAGSKDDAVASVRPETAPAPIALSTAPPSIPDRRAADRDPDVGLSPPAAALAASKDGTSASMPPEAATAPAAPPTAPPLVHLRTADRESGADLSRSVAPRAVSKDDTGTATPPKVAPSTAPPSKPDLGTADLEPDVSHPSPSPSPTATAPALAVRNAPKPYSAFEETPASRPVHRVARRSHEEPQNRGETAYVDWDWSPLMTGEVRR